MQTCKGWLQHFARRFTMVKKIISMPVIRRLPRYFRFLSLLENRGVHRISSKELAEKMNVNASQIRQDFNCFGDFGQQGYGYVVGQLRKATGHILGLENSYPSIIIGAGNLGKALISHINFEDFGFKLVGAFDVSPNLIGTQINGNEILSIDKLSEFCKKEKPVMAIICIPLEDTPTTVKSLYELGIRNYWNFTLHDILLDYNDVIVENIHLNDSLMTLCYRISHSDDN